MKNSKYQIISYLTLRTLIGAIGILLPIILGLGYYIFGMQMPFPDSISDFYGTPLRDVFVGFLFVLGFYLLSYKGYDNDNTFANFGALFAICVAVFPATSNESWVRMIHLISAGFLFSLFAYFALRIFKKGEVISQQTLQKKTRNKIYTYSGIVIIFSVIGAGSSFFLDDAINENYNIVFWFETLALWAFGFSWLVKGEVFWKDIN